MLGLARIAQAHRNVGGDPYWNQVSSLLHMDGTDGSTSFIDEKGNIWTAAGNAKLTTAAPLYGTASGTFDGTGDIVSASSAAWNDLSTGDFTIEFAFKGPLTKDSTVLSKRTGGATGWAIEVRATGSIWLRAAINGTYHEPALQTAVGVVAANTLSRICLQRSSTTYSIFAEGVQIITQTYSGSLDNSGNALRIGSANAAGEDYLLAVVDEYRITKGIARYTSAGYTPSSSPFPNH